MNPGYITGLAQTDGSFFCTLSLSLKHLFGIQFRPKFSITCDLNSINVLEEIKTYFNCGTITINVKNHSAEYVVSKISDLINIIIPHFLNFPLFCAKLHAFNIFVKIVNALYNKTHRTLEGRQELLILALSMNESTVRKEDRIELLFNKLDIVEEEDKALIPCTINSIETELSDDVLAGIIDGDGSFYISFGQGGKITTGFSITNDSLSRPLLELIQTKFEGIGSITEGTKNELVYTVGGINQILNIVIPFMDQNPLCSERASHYESFRKVSLLLKDKHSLTLNDKIELVELYYNSNKGGKHRKITKEEYLNNLKNSNSNSNSN